MTHRTSLRFPCLLVALGLAASAATACNREKAPVLDIDDGVVAAAVPPPAISGGTLIVTRDGARAVAADPDRDLVWVAALAQGALEHAIVLETGDEPGRLVEDAAGRVHVALRRGGAVATIDPAAGTVVRRAPVCAAPRGLAYDDATDQLHVACAGGALVSLAAGSLAEVRRVALDGDLRDVVLHDGALLVSRFRSAELLSVGEGGVIASRLAAPPAQVEGFDEVGQSIANVFLPDVAWRTIARPGGGAVMVHQRAMATTVSTQQGGYAGGECGSVVHGAISVFRPAADGSGAIEPPLAATTMLAGALPVDVAVSQDGAVVAVVMAGSQGVMRLDASMLELATEEKTCMFPDDAVDGTPIAVAFRGTDIVVQTRQPATISIRGGATIALPGEDVSDTGHDMFHQAQGFGSLACASCHPEGREDGHVWDFDDFGLRRTQSLLGGILDTAPLHWGGDMADLDAIMEAVLVGRMGGERPGPRRARILARWLDALPAPAPVRDPNDAAAARGKVLFEDTTVGCATCHAGPALTNNRNEDVGRGEALQVPSLVGVGLRAPFMHDGCAATLRDRFDPTCGGTKHGAVDALSAEQLDDLVAYLESL